MAQEAELLQCAGCLHFFQAAEMSPSQDESDPAAVIHGLYLCDGCLIGMSLARLMGLDGIVVVDANGNAVELALQ